MKRYISNSTQITHLALLLNGELDKAPGAIPVTIGKAVKTHEQLGYLHTEVLPKFTATMFTSGEIEKNTENYGKYHLKVLIGYGEWLKYKNAKVFNPFSFADADTEILSKAIDEAIRQCEARGTYVAPPKERKHAL